MNLYIISFQKIHICFFFTVDELGNGHTDRQCTQKRTLYQCIISVISPRPYPVPETERVITARKRSLGQSNIFTSVCDSFCSQGEGGVMMSIPVLSWTAHPPNQQAGGTHPTGMLSLLNVCHYINSPRFFSADTYHPVEAAFQHLHWHPICPSQSNPLFWQVSDK